MRKKTIDDLNSENRLLREQINEVQNRYEEKIEELSLIRELGMSLLHVHEFRRLCQHILETIINNTVAQNCSIMLLDQEKGQLFLLCAMSPNPNKDCYILESEKVFSKEDAVYTFKAGEGIAGRALTEKKPVLIKSSEESDTFVLDADNQIKINSLLSVPLMIEGESIGVINLSHSEEAMFEPNDVYLFNVIAGFVTILIHGALNYEKLQYSEANYRALSEYSNNGIAIIQDDVHYYANPRYQGLTGYSLHELKRMSLKEIFDNPFPGTELSSILSNLRYELNNGVFHARMIRKGGEGIDVEISASSIIYNGKRRLILSMLDITDRKILERQLIQAQKMQSMGTLAGGIAHNFNNLLMGIQGNVSIALTEIDSGHPYYSNLTNIEKLVRNGSKLTNELLGYAREGKYEVKPVNLSTLAKETSEIFGATRKDIKIKLDLTDKIFGVLADQGQIEQTMLNIYVNAGDAMPEGGEISLKTVNLTDQDIRDKSYTPKSGNYVLLSIRDTGIGMDKKTMERIFEPFFTTKGLAKGTGLGLASAYGIVKGHGGYIDVSSKEGQGTVFNIYLPATNEIMAKNRVPSDALYMGAGTVLLVDDEDIVLYTGEQMLAKLGYVALTARSGEEALKIYQENRNSIDLVLLDMVMPDMGGGTTFDRLKEINKDVKVLLSSGYSLNGQATEIMNKGCAGFIQKPFDLKKLSQKVKEIIN